MDQLLEFTAPYIDPGKLLYMSLTYHLSLLYETLFKNHDFLGLFDVAKIRDTAFSRFWSSINPPPDKPTPVEELQGSMAGFAPMLAKAHGVVLEPGPGSGAILHYINSEKVDKMYGAEPTVGLHPVLLNSARAAGLGKKYTILKAGGEADELIPALSRAGLDPADEQGVFDTVICCRVLCSVKNQAETIEMIYNLLKPGGLLLVNEHIKTRWREDPGSRFMGRAFQRLWMLLGWQFFLAGCSLERDTIDNLQQLGKRHGGWADVKLVEVNPHGAIPFVSGTFMKKK